MPLTDYQKWWTWDDFRRALQADANQLNTILLRMADHKEYLDRMTAQDLNDMNVPSDAQTIAANWRTALGELETFCGGSSVTPTVELNEIIDKIRTI